MHVRTPEGLLVSQAVTALQAEDEDGWFGILPGRADLVAALVPGLLVYRDDGGKETFIAHSGGLLSLEGTECRATLRDALVSTELADIATALDAHLTQRRERQAQREDALAELAREALRRVIEEARE